MDGLATATSPVVPVSPLYDATQPLLRVALAGYHLFDRTEPLEVMVFRERFGVWLSLVAVPSAQRRDEYRAIEWGPRGIDDMMGAHFFPSRWELLTWVEARFSTAA